MRSGVLLELLDDLARDREDGQDSGARLLAACVSVIQVTGAGIMLMVDDEQRGSFGGSDDASRAVEDLQFTLGQGPCIDSYRTGHPVLEPHLADPTLLRWPEFSGKAVLAGIQAIFGFPLTIGTVRIGALDVYCDTPGDLSPQQFEDALVMAKVVTKTVVDLQADEDSWVLAAALDHNFGVRTVVYQAAGMVSAQLDVSMASGMARLRSYAATVEQPLKTVARHVVDRDLRIG